MKILLRDFSAKVDEEDILKPTVLNDSLHEIYDDDDDDDDGDRVVNFATSRNLTIEVQCSNTETSLHLLGCLLRR
jgi:hypothetical protein